MKDQTDQQGNDDESREYWHKAWVEENYSIQKMRISIQHKEDLES